MAPLTQLGCELDAENRLVVNVSQYLQADVNNLVENIV
jgi:hypothetical protein